jgi:hypothetical protein
MKKHALLIFVLLCFLVSCKYFGDPITKLKGSVKDIKGNYLENVSVDILGDENGEVINIKRKQITKSDGFFEFNFIGYVPANIWIKYEKEGFKTVKQDLLLESEKVNVLDVVMEKE